jgi:hypothetical protein
VPPSGAGTPPVLVVQAAHDPATPLEGARRTVAALPAARLLLVTGDGDHGQYAGGNACVDRAVERWITAGRLPAVGATCHGKGVPDPFSSGFTARGARPQDTAGAPSAGVPGNPLLGLDRLRGSIRSGLSLSLCRTAGAAGC